MSIIYPKESQTIQYPKRTQEPTKLSRRQSLGRPTIATSAKTSIRNGLPSPSISTQSIADRSLPTKNVDLANSEKEPLPSPPNTPKVNTLSHPPKSTPFRSRAGSFVRSHPLICVDEKTTSHALPGSIKTCTSWVPLERPRASRIMPSLNTIKPFKHMTSPQLPCPERIAPLRQLHQPNTDSVYLYTPRQSRSIDDEAACSKGFSRPSISPSVVTRSKRSASMSLPDNGRQPTCVACNRHARPSIIPSHIPSSSPFTLIDETSSDDQSSFSSVPPSPSSSRDGNKEASKTCYSNGLPYHRLKKTCGTQPTITSLPPHHCITSSLVIAKSDIAPEPYTLSSEPENLEEGSGLDELVESCRRHFRMLEQLSKDILTSEERVKKFFSIQQSIEASLETREREYYNQRTACELMLKQQQELMIDTKAMIQKANIDRPYSTEFRSILSDPPLDTVSESSSLARANRESGQVELSLPDHLSGYDMWVLQCRWQVSQWVGGALGRGSLTKESMGLGSQRITSKKSPKLTIIGTGCTREPDILLTLTKLLQILELSKTVKLVSIGLIADIIAGGVGMCFAMPIARISYLCLIQMNRVRGHEFVICASTNWWESHLYTLPLHKLFESILQCHL
ncbi:hypothetical protein PHYBLDRAFT_143391 [Phycomyces blakesleeanus NRRL 1555(-)]|uniref:Uncharacterized protein n=1 Tax=Phycomyces blakesleeanus (strain ATCC 8743b / DSM 1359 / FGSC 10004 / NBRC 33097 / NRRL 1555) TaxID=763407 RepID=A0A162PVL6_PHYB8|nr:hypothetical protein PHYBLDRAFT_143391 [Phycomyces blakesleeanus NRRL 1555(-)]OAD76417.1 hypothetical protein PHYBLDRAFT_143391 [Phycomyces blakesleeanus NRRL 1555(-)]|eukprot:XP_018294457.1 hypothetical protein PHYBLDRAFT_143391 [Phycomyces blakesleeanus NRRL 1555(-)]